MTARPGARADEAARVIVAELRREARTRRWTSALAVGAAFAAAVLAAHHRSGSGADWALAVALAVAALGAAAGAASRAWAPFVVVAAPSLALGVTLATGAAGDLAATLGAECIATALGCAAVVLAGAWLALRRGTSSLGWRASTASAAAGALGGLAALELTCPAHVSRSHLLSFHVTGVLLAIAIAGVTSSFTSRRLG